MNPKTTDVRTAKTVYQRYPAAKSYETSRSSTAFSFQKHNTDSGDRLPITGTIIELFLVPRTSTTTGTVTQITVSSGPDRTSPQPLRRRRFFVVRDSDKGKDAITALPIKIYSGTGVKKTETIKSNHSVVYTGDTPALSASSAARTSSNMDDILNTLSRLTRKSLRQHLPSGKEYVELSIKCTLNGHRTSSFPDTGACANFISRSYVDQHKVAIDTGSARKFKNGIGRTIKSLGTVILPFSFKGETSSHELEFHVIPKSVHDVVLGESFLRLTETFSRFKDRVIRKVRHTLSRRLLYLGSPQQRIAGYLNEVAVGALGDTGSDILALSTSYAKRRSFVVNRSKEYRVLVAFADGSTAKTRGIVRNVAWRFGSSPSDVYHRDFYVLDDLECDVILDYDFLYNTDAFHHYKDCVNRSSLGDMEEDLFFCTIQRIARSSEGQDLAEAPTTALMHWLQVKSDHMDRICKLPSEEREQAKADFYRWWRPKFEDIQRTIRAARQSQIDLDGQTQRPPEAPIQSPSQHRPTAMRKSRFSRIWKRNRQSSAENPRGP